MQLHRLVPAQPSEEPEVTGWHADPSNPDLIVHPDGRFMSMSAEREGLRQAAYDRARTSYLAFSYLPFALSLVLPFLVWQGMGEWNSPFGLLLLTGWVPYCVGVVGTLVTSDKASSPALVGLRRTAGTCAVLLGLWGLLATFGLMLLGVLGAIGGAANQGL